MKFGSQRETVSQTDRREAIERNNVRVDRAFIVNAISDRSLSFQIGATSNKLAPSSSVIGKAH